MSQGQAILKSALYGRHVAMGAKMGEEAGWEMPLSYGGVIEEVRQVRSRAGVSDVSHLGRLRIRGAGAVELLERLCTADAVHQEDNTALGTLLCNADGGIIDQCFLLRLEDFWVLTTSAVNRRKVLGHIQAHCGGLDVKVDDQTDRTVMLSVSGPAAAGILDAVLPFKVSDLPAGRVLVGSLLIARYIGMRVSYSGQWGLEVIVPNMAAGLAWDFITKKAGAGALPPVGLGARDVLRIEAGLPRYGHELNETIDPLTAGLESCVDFPHEFLGREAVLRIRQRGPGRRRVGLVFATPNGKPAPADGPQDRLEHSIPRQGAAVLTGDGREVGTVTSGTYSPTLDKVIAMAYVAPDAAGAGTELLVGHDAERQGARVVKFPFLAGRKD